MCFAAKIGARWQSGHAAACKAVYAGSIPTLASTIEGMLPSKRVIRSRSVESPPQTGSRSASIAATLGVVLLVLALARGRRVRLLAEQRAHQPPAPDDPAEPAGARAAREAHAHRSCPAGANRSPRDSRCGPGGSQSTRHSRSRHLPARLHGAGAGRLDPQRDGSSPQRRSPSCARPGSDPSRSISLALEPSSATEIGYAQGWTITSGQSITVSSSGFRSVTAFAP